MPTEKELMLKQSDAETTYQRKLTAGTNITIDPVTNIISSAGGGSTVQYTDNTPNGESVGILAINGQSHPIRIPKLAEGTGITINKDITTNVYTISLSGGGGGTTKTYMGETNPDELVGEDGDLYFKYHKIETDVPTELTLPSLPDDATVPFPITNFSSYDSFTFYYTDGNNEPHNRKVNIGDIVISDNPASTQGSNIYTWNSYRYVQATRSTNGEGLVLRVCGNCLYKLEANVTEVDLGIDKSYAKVEDTWLPSGEQVEANPEETSETPLTKIKIDGVTYYIAAGGSAEIVPLTKAEWDALPASKYTDNILYLITDSFTTETIITPNPEGEATDTLTKLQIDETIYSLAGESGAAAIEKTLSEYNALTPAQKENGSIYMVQGEGASEDAFDMTQGSSYNEGSMSFTATETDIESVWNGGSSIGGDWRTIAIDVTKLTAIKFSIKTTTCYAHDNSNVEEQTTPRFVNTVYLFTSIPSGWAYDYESQATDFLKFAYTNTDYGEQEFDVSELTGQIYIIWASTGWNAVMSDLTLVGKSSLNNRIFFMNEEYANTGGGTGAGAIEKTQVEYNALPQDQKKNGAIYMVQGEAEIIETPIDMSSITSNIEVSSIMSVASTTDTTTVTYNRAGDGIGCTFYYTNKIDLTTVNQVKFGLETGDNYYQADSPQNPIHIGFCSTAPSGFSPTFDVEEEYYLRNHTYDSADCVIDTSELTGEYYLTVISHGWNLTISDFVLEDTGEVLENKIYYMGTEYANTNGGGSGGGSSIIPNPEEEPTDTLNTVKIDGTVYNIESGSEGEGVEIYSEDEYIVGKWIDGKNVYQRTYTNLSVQTSGSSWIHISTIDTSTWNEAIDCEVYRTMNGKYAKIPLAEVSTNVSGINDLAISLVSSTFDSVITALTVRYTKTVETPAPAWGGSVTNNYASFIDTDNVIQAFTQISDTSEHTYTATEDCIVTYYVASQGDTYIKINNVLVGGNYSQSVSALCSFVAVKKGQTFSFQQSYAGSSSSGYTVYGISYGSGGSSNGNSVHYSTTEQVIGTWIDGKPLYQKTYENLNIGTDKNYSLTLSDLQNIEYLRVVPEGSQVSALVPFPYVHYNSNNDISYFIDSITNGVPTLAIRKGSEMSSQSNLQFLTIQYTKTTD